MHILCYTPETATVEENQEPQKETIDELPKEDSPEEESPKEESPEEETAEQKDEPLVATETV